MTGIGLHHDNTQKNVVRDLAHARELTFPDIGDAARREGFDIGLCHIEGVSGPETSA